MLKIARIFSMAALLLGPTLPLVAAPQATPASRQGERTQTFKGSELKELPSACDRACLTGIADLYFTALVAHTPTALIAPGAKFTEQAVVTKVGEGLWKTAAEAPSSFKIYVPDPVAGQIGGIVMMKDVGPKGETRDIQVGFRLKVQNRQITEAEHLVAPITNPAMLANLQKPRPGLLENNPPNDRLPREILLLFGHGYYDALEQSDGQAVPFADECVRRENGIHTAGPRPAGAPAGPPIPGTAPAGARTQGAAPEAAAPGATTAPAGGRGPTSANASNIGSMTCAGQLDTRFMSYIEKIELRRVWIADPDRGLVFGLSMFRHPMNEKVLTLVYPDGTRGTRDMTTQRTFDMAAAHILKVRNNRIYEIEATGFTLPLNSPNGWSEFLR